MSESWKFFMKNLNFCPCGPAQHPAPLQVRLDRFAWSKNDLFRDRGLVVPADVVRHCDLSYGPWGDWNLLDVYLPKNASHSLPTIVSIHGGGYFYGDKELYSHYGMNLAQRGFGVVNFNYRLAPEHHFPAPLEDTNQVFHWLWRHGADYGLDLNNVFLVGDSAGAQLASQYAALWSDPSYAALFGLEFPPIPIRALGLNCGIYDLPNGHQHGRDVLMKNYLGEDFPPDDPRLDVLAHIGPGYPPTFLLSAPNDFLYACCLPMAEFLQKQGVEAEAHIYGTLQDQTVQHVFHLNMRCPEGKQANFDETAFFRRHLSQTSSL